MEGGTMTIYKGGAAVAQEEDDGCGGYRSRMKPATDVLARTIVLSKSMILKAGLNSLKNSNYRWPIETINAMKKLFYLVDDWAAKQTQTQGTCSTMARATWGWLGRIDCAERDRRANSMARKINGAIGHVIKYIIDFFGSDSLTWLFADGITSTLLMTSMQEYISRVLLEIICTITHSGRIATWRVIKIIITATLKYVNEVSSMGLQAISNMAVTIGGGLVQYFLGLPDTTLDNDVREVGEALLNRTDEFIENNGLDLILDAIDELEHVEDRIDEGAAVEAYEASEEAEALDMQAKEAAEFMAQYLTDSLEQTKEGGAEYDDHKLLRDGLLWVSGRRYDDNEGPENQVVSQPLIFLSDDDEMEVESDEELQRANTFGGIIQKKDKPFIKNLKESAQRMKNKYKLGKKHKKRTQKHKKPKGRNMRARSRKAGYKYFNRNSRKTPRRKNKRNKTKRRKFM